MIVLQLGSKVEIGGRIHGIVTAISIRPRGIAYECVWWDGNNRRCEFLEEMEITPLTDEKRSIGFKST